ANDIEKATEIARNMVTKWGLSDRLGPLSYGEDDTQPFIGGQTGSSSKQFSDETAHSIDEEVRTIIDSSYNQARKMLEDNMDTLHLMAQTLMKYETIDADQISQIMEGKTPGPPEGWTDSDLPGSGPISGTGAKRPTAPDGAAKPASQH